MFVDGPAPQPRGSGDRRSPSHRKKPESANNKANATVRIALELLPGVEPPLWRTATSQPAAIVTVDRLDLTPALT